MTVLTEKDLNKQFAPTKDEVDAYIKDHRQWVRSLREKNPKRLFQRVKRHIRDTRLKHAIGRKTSFTSNIAARQIVYGRCRVPGVISYIGKSTDGLTVDFVFTIAGHEIEAIDYVFLDGERVNLGASPDARWSLTITTEDGSLATADHKVFVALNSGALDQTVQPDLNALRPSDWGTNYRQRGCAHVFVRLAWDSQLFPEGIPEVDFQVQGKKCYDPRSGLTVWTQNAALILADFWTDTRVGCSIPSAEVDWVRVGAMADICDQRVPLAEGGDEARYQINGYFTTDDDKDSIEEDMLASMAGVRTYTGGKWKMRAGGPEGFPTLTLTENDLRSEVTIKTKRSREDSFNAVRGTFVDFSKGYEEADFPPVKNDLYYAQDGNERIWDEVQYPFVVSSTTCQRLSKIRLEKNRQGIEVDAIWGLVAWQLEKGDNVYLTLPRYGWASKPFEVIEEPELIASTEENNLTFDVALSLRETAAGVYDWAMGEETVRDLAPNTSLASPFQVGMLQNVVLSSGTSELYIRADGTVFSRLKVSWDSVVDPSITQGGRIQVEYRKLTDFAWSVSPSVPGLSTYTHILDVQDGATYAVRVRGESALGIYGTWTTIESYQIVGKTAAPSNVAALNATVDGYGISLSWSAVADLDVRQYEIRLGASFDAGTFLAYVSGTNYRLETRVAGTYDFWIKAVDTSGNKSSAAVGASATIAGPAAPAPTFTIEGPNILLAWSPPGSQFAVESYEISSGASAGATPIATIKGTKYTLKASFSGTRRYWIQARDVAGNLGAGGYVDVEIVAPGLVVGLSAQVVDNNVLLRWTIGSTGTLPVERYRVYKGATFGGAEALGEVSGTFAARFEIVAGTYSYWIAAVDSAGNQGAEQSVTAHVDQPPDFVYRAQTALDPRDADTLTNIVFENPDAMDPTFVKMIAPIPVETYAAHFANRSWATPQAQIDAGYPIFIQPGVNGATYVQTWDTGALATEGSLVTLAYLVTAGVGTVTVTPRISWSPDGSSWTDGTSGEAQVFASNFRYVKVTLSFWSDDDHNFVLVGGLTVTVATKTKRDGGSGTAASGDSGGTTVNFNKTFIDISSITVTAKYNASYPITAVYDFTDTANPTTFKVLLYRTDTGARVSGGFSWVAEGI